MMRRPPRSTRTGHTLSLHDALPIAGGVADHRELGDEILGRRRALRLVEIVHLVAEGVARLVEDHRHVGGAVGLVEFVDQLPQHRGVAVDRSEEHTSELQSLMRISYAVFCLTKKNITKN